MKTYQEIQNDVMDELHWVPAFNAAQLDFSST